MTNTMVVRVRWKMKHGYTIEEFVGLCQKMYSILLADSNEECMDKGVKKCIIWKKFLHQHYYVLVAKDTFD